MSLPFGQLTASVDRRGTWSASSRNSMVQDAICICISNPSTRVPAGRAMFQMLGVFSEFERSIIRSRVKARLARARLHGPKGGKPIGQQPLARQKVEAIRAELAEGTGIIKAARLCGIGVSVVQRMKRETAPVPA
jgi:DNA invertase Pin-like site-specific DNA recombinase